MLIAHAAEHFDEQDAAFIHAVGLAAPSGAGIATLHVTQGRRERAAAPQPAALLQRWALPVGRVSQRLHETPGHEEVADELIGACEVLRPDLVVLETHARMGLARVFAGSIAEAVARNVTAPCLLLPIDCKGFVDARSGRVDLSRMLVLGGSTADAQLGLDAAAWLARIAGQTVADVMLLHVVDGTASPVTHAPASLRVHNELRHGELEPAVIAAARKQDAALLVMVSRGHDGMGDVLWSNHTERVLHAVCRPLLWVPAAWRASVVVD